MGNPKKAVREKTGHPGKFGITGYPGNFGIPGPGVPPTPQALNSDRSLLKRTSKNTNEVPCIKKHVKKQDRNCH